MNDQSINQSVNQTCLVRSQSINLHESFSTVEADEYDTVCLCLVSFLFVRTSDIRYFTYYWYRLVQTMFMYTYGRWTIALSDGKVKKIAQKTYVN